MEASIDKTSENIERNWWLFGIHVIEEETFGPQCYGSISQLSKSGGDRVKRHLILARDRIVFDNLGRFLKTRTNLQIVK